MLVVNLPCHLPKSDDPIGDCLRAREPAKRTIYVIGDSHASNHVPSVSAAAARFENLEIRHLVEWGFIKVLDGLEHCIEDGGSRPCLDGGFAKQMDYFAKNLRAGDIVIFSWARDRVMHEGPLPRQPNLPALDVLKRKLVEIRSVVVSTGAQLVLVEDIPKPCNDAVNWQIIYSTGRHELCSATVAQSKEDRRPLSGVYASVAAMNGVRIFDPHDALCRDNICGIYDPLSRSLIYSENSPHFTAARPAPLVNEWTAFLSKILAN
jgi:hypothetical protein